MLKTAIDMINTLRVNPQDTDVDCSRHSVYLLAPVYKGVKVKYSFNLKTLTLIYV